MKKNSSYKNVVVGIDASSVKLAIVVTGPPEMQTFRKYNLTRGRDKTAACYEASQHVEDFMFILCDVAQRYGTGKVHVYLERLLVGRGGPGGTIPQAQVAGAVMAAVGLCRANERATLTLVTPGEWKKDVIHYGAASKELVTARLKRRWPEAYKAALSPRGKIDQDIVDAACINMYGRMQLLRKR